MKNLFIIIMVLMASHKLDVYSQNLIAVQNDSSLSFYLTLNEAVNQAIDGDTLYLPGGSYYNCPNITKRIHIIGVGHNPDSTINTMPTYITGNIYLEAGASWGSISGIIVPGAIYFGNSSAAENFTISRCNIGSVGSYQSYGWGFSPKNNIFIENVIGSVFFAGGQSNYFFNNILIYSLGQIGYHNVIKNNIFLAQNYPIYSGDYGIHSSTFENNIFIATSSIQSYGSGYFGNNIFRNNIFVENITFPYYTTNIGINNIVNQSQSSIFINQNGNSFNYIHDYHLQSSCPGHNAGRDGTDIGIYGGTFPWKDGSIPFNPHYQSIVVSPQSDSTGNLNVIIQVEAQHR